ncbi:MAG TPA: sulfotransferase family 2 domain-containing protein [Rhizomicrobium sp.]
MSAENSNQLMGGQQTSSELKPRTLVFHYHLFKNAGTSVDEILKKNFGRRWQAREFDVPWHDIPTAIMDFFREPNDLLAVSSHTALLPAPRIKGIDFFSLVFIRHPIDRLRSAYEFERIQEVDTLGAKLAKAHDFGGYLRELLKNKHHRQARNFQTFRLALNERNGPDPECERAKRALETLSFIGLVEAYDRSIALLEQLLTPIFPDFLAINVHRNVARSRENDLETRLEKIKYHLGMDFYEEICALNEDDIALYNILKKKFGG